MSFAVAGFLGVAGQALAADKLECSVVKDGKKTTHMVESTKACTKLGGKIVEGKPVAKPGTTNAK
jgi:hypothetical protein